MNSAPNTSLQHRPPDTLILFRILGRRSWGELQRWHRALPGSSVEHVLKGIFILRVPAGGARSAR